MPEGQHHQRDGDFCPGDSWLPGPCRSLRDGLPPPDWLVPPPLVPALLPVPVPVSSPARWQAPSIEAVNTGTPSKDVQRE